MGLDVLFFKVEEEYEDQELMTTAYECYYDGFCDSEGKYTEEELKEAICELEDDKVLRISNMDDFEYHSYPLKRNHFYKINWTGSFRAGSYSEYGFWRRMLCKKVLGVDIEEVWVNPDLYIDKPFYWLLNFADNEGVIAGEPFEKLKKDFDDHDFDFKDEYYNEKWRLWKGSVLKSDGVEFN